jgi:CRP-like cAMP-binding protein
MPNRLLRKLENFTRLSDKEKQALEQITTDRKRIGPHQDIVSEGDLPEGVHLVLEGFACRYKMLSDGRRQIISHFIPGDFCDLRVFIVSEMDHTVGTISTVTLASIPRKKVIALTDDFPRITQALWWSTMVDEAITREWIVNVGKRTALERVAHLLCEHFLRMRAVGLADEENVEMPMTQAELADTVALSIVHVNRTLQRLRREGLIKLHGKLLTILDLPGLQEVSGFNPNYLHFLHKPFEVTSNDRARAQHAADTTTPLMSPPPTDGDLTSGQGITSPG